MRGATEADQEREILRARRKEEMPNAMKTSPKKPETTTRIN
jgi:hypothetical protein